LLKFIRVGPIGPGPLPSACSSLRRVSSASALRSARAEQHRRAPCGLRFEAAERGAQRSRDRSVHGIASCRALKNDRRDADILVRFNAHVFIEGLNGYHR
jgi:hypothetical protein